VWSRNLKNEEAKARYRAMKIQPQWVVTFGKQTTNIYIICGKSVRGRKYIWELSDVMVKILKGFIIDI
jgi:hypothetical protein